MKIRDRVNKDHVLDPNGRRLLELCKSTGLLIANGRLHTDNGIGEFTFCSRGGMSVVDYLLVNNNDMSYVNSFEIVDLNEFSDHSAVKFSIETLVKGVSTTDEPCDVESAKRIVWDKTRADEFKNRLVEKDTDLNNLIENMDNHSIEESVNCFTIFLHNCAMDVFGKNKYVKKQKRSCKERKPWFNARCSEARDEFVQARKKFKRCKTNENRQHFMDKRSNYNKIKQREKRIFMRNEGKKISSLARVEPKQFWKTIKRQYNNEILESESLNSNDIYEAFKNIYGNDCNVEVDNSELFQQSINDTDLDDEITQEEIYNAVFSQKNCKSPGIDEISAEILKASYHLISPYLTRLFNRLFKNGEYPTAWGNGIICPIFKGGNVDDTSNYRGVTLVNILAKVYSYVLSNRLSKWAEKNEKISSSQFGFQKGKSTVDCIFTLHSIIAKTLASKKKLYCAFIDLEKAFDKVERSYLWQKLLNEKVSTKMVKSLKAMYNTVKACIRYKSKISGTFDSHIGVKQGDQCSSIMFLFFINDVVDAFKCDLDGIFSINEIKLFILLFADDAVIFSQNPETLQSLLMDFEQYCLRWELKVNSKKTKIMIFEKSRPSTYNFYINGDLLEIVTSFKYLGVHFFKNGNWFRTQKRLAQHASYALHKLFIVYNQLDILNSEKCKLFDSLVGSILNYTAEVWGFNTANDIEMIHKKFCRKILKVKKSTNVTAIYGELGRIPYRIIRKIKMVNYWNKILHLTQNATPKLIYQMLKADVENHLTYNGQNWAFQVKTILDEIGMTNLWLEQENIEIPVHIIKQRILDIYEQTWNSEINNSSRLDTFSTFKQTIAFENYLDFIYEDKYRIAFTRFRTSSHELEIERGRYHDIPRHERTCKNCQMRVLESEFHFLLACPKYRHLRAKYFKKYYYHWPTLQKFKNLMSSKSKAVQINISKFIYHANKIRVNNAATS